MAGEWQESKVIDVAQINTATYSTNEKWEYVNYLDTSNITNGQLAEVQLISDLNSLPSRARRKVQSGDIVYSTVRPNQRHYGIIKKPDDNMLVSTGFAVLRGKNQILDTKFLYYFLIQDHIVEKLQTIAEHSTSAYPSIRPSDIGSLELGFPPLSEQQAIACILGTLDDKIELNRQMNKTLEEMARAIFKSWFVDFLPVRAKMAARTQAGGLKPEIAKLFPDSFENSELGEIPKGWKIGTLGNVADHPRRGIKPKEIKSDTPYIALEHMPRNCIALSDWVTAENLESNKFEFKKGEILFGKLRPYFHKVGVAPVNGVCSTDIVVVVGESMKWFGFVLGHISSTEFVEYTNAGSTGTKMPRTSWIEMARYQIVLPPEPLASAFTAFIQPSVERIIANINETITLASLRDVLLPKLISGGLRVMVEERFFKERGL